LLILRQRNPLQEIHVFIGDDIPPKGHSGFLGMFQEIKKARAMIGKA